MLIRRQPVNTSANSEFLCNIMFKHKMDVYNEDTIRQNIINVFKEEFSNVWFTIYDDIVVCCEIDSEAIFISQAGVFRYLFIPDEKYLTIEEYFKKEYFTVSIVMDIYDNKESETYTEGALDYRLVPLISFIDYNGEAKPRITDKNLSESFLGVLLEKLSLFYSTINVVKKYYGEVL